MVTAMMLITRLNAALMVGTVVELVSTQNTVWSVCVMVKLQVMVPKWFMGYEAHLALMLWDTISARNFAQIYSFAGNLEYL